MLSGRNFAILVMLLFSLSVSRGEGVHIFPFADSSPGEYQTGVLDTDGNIEYRDCIIPQEGFQPSQPRFDSAEPTPLIGAWGLPPLDAAVDPILARSERRPAHAAQNATKFALTSSSDRSPPSVAAVH